MGAKTITGCEVLTTLWFTHLGDQEPIGMVLVKCKHYKVAYLGRGLGDSERGDAVHVAETGSKLPKEIAEAAFKGWDLADYKTN